MELTELTKEKWSLDQFVLVVNELIPKFLQIDSKDKVSERMVRLYTTENLLDNPERDGKSPIYSYRHLLQILAIRRLLCEGLSINLVQQTIVAKENPELKAILENGFQISVIAKSFNPDLYFSGLTEWKHIELQPQFQINVRSDFSPPSSEAEEVSLFASIKTIFNSFRKEKTMDNDEFEQFTNQYLMLLDDLLEQINRLPDHVTKSVKREIRDLQAFIQNRRFPRFMLVGRRGHGKSSIINAIFSCYVREVGSVLPMTGKSEWEDYRQGIKGMEILDTRGLREGSQPIEYDDADTAFESIMNAVKVECPDATVWVIKAKEVSAGIDLDLDDLEEIIEGIEAIYGFPQPLVVVVSQCDELDPAKIDLPTDNDQKNNNISVAVNHVTELVRERVNLKNRLVKVIPIAAYAMYKEDKSLDLNQDYRWNIDLLVEYLLNELPVEAKVEFVRVAKIRKFQKEIANNVIQAFSVVSAVVGGLTPIPGIDVAPIIALQVGMVIVVAYISGRKFSYKSAWEFFAGLGIGAVGRIALRELAGAILDFIPVFGNVASAAIDGLVTKQIGNAAIAYFIDETPINKVRDMMPKRDRGLDN